LTILDILKQLLGNKADEEINIQDSISQEVSEVDDNINNKDEQPDKVDTERVDTETVDIETEASDNSKDVTDENEEAGGVHMKLFEDGWFNSETGQIVESKIKSPEVLDAIKVLTDRYQAEKEQRVISDSLNDELKNYSLNVSDDTLRKCLDMSNIKIDKEGKVVGVKDALEALKSAEPGFFKDKEKESNPLNEGFNPVVKHNTDNINSFSQAFKLMEEIN
jgi:hypothetical protein